jgi:PAS domain S-box-containing protein
VILVIDAETGVVVEANRRSAEVLGGSSNEIIGRNAETIVSECDREAYRRMVQATRAGRSVADRELHLDRADGSTLAVEVNAVMTEFAGRKLIQGIFRDIGERKRVEEETRQAQKMEVVGRLVGGIAHDFNNLLMVILTQLRKIRASPSQPPVLEHAETARIAAERAASLTSQLLSFGRRQVLVLQVVDLNELLEEVKEMLSALPTEQVRLTMTLSVESLPVKVDPGKIEQVIMNLAINACDAMPSGGDLIIRTARVLRPTAERGRSEDAIVFAMLEVTDTGYGMDTETKAHLFEPFFTTKPFGKGTGLGLSTAYGIVKQSGGSIEVESSLGNGSTFRVYLPMVEQTEGPRTIREWPASSLRGSETILLAEDQPAIRGVLREFLEAHGYRVLEAQNGNEAREIAKTYAGTIDVLVADVIMPHIRGTELAKLLTELRPEISVVLISGYSEDALLESHLLAEKNVILIQKPFEPEELVQKIRQALPGSPTPPGPRRS